MHFDIGQISKDLLSKSRFCCSQNGGQSLVKVSNLVTQISSIANLSQIIGRARDQCNDGKVFRLELEATL